MKKQTEHNLQSACIKWFRLQYPSETLHSIPNGTKMSPVTGKWYNTEGRMAGVADCFLAAPSQEIDLYNCKQKIIHGAYIEFKSEKGKQTDTQREFEKRVTYKGYKYWVIRDFEDFRNKINKYLEAR